MLENDLAARVGIIGVHVGVLIVIDGTVIEFDHPFASDVMLVDFDV